MIAGAEINSLGNAAVAADLDLSQRIKPDTFTDPGVITDFNVPRIFNVDGRFENHTLANASPEQAQKNDFQFR